MFELYCKAWKLAGVNCGFIERYGGKCWLYAEAQNICGRYWCPADTDAADGNAADGNAADAGTADASTAEADAGKADAGAADVIADSSEDRRDKTKAEQIASPS